MSKEAYGRLSKEQSEWVCLCCSMSGLPFANSSLISMSNGECELLGRQSSLTEVEAGFSRLFDDGPLRLFDEGRDSLVVSHLKH